MMTDNDTIGAARDHRWIRAGEQRKLLDADGCRVIVELDGKKSPVTLETLVRLVRPGTLVKLAHAFLLADPRARNKRGGMKASFDAALKLITEKRGGAVKDLETGLTTEQPEHRRAIVALSHNHIARSNRGLRSALNGLRSRGRPKAWADPAVRKIIWDEWHSSTNKTNADAVKAAEAKLGRKVWMATMFRIVKEMRREKGAEGAGGASGRLPGSPLLREQKKAKRRRVYFIGCGDMVKIGFSGTIKNRVMNIRVSSPHETVLLGTMSGDFGLEGKLHRRFAEYHVRGEWFRNVGRLAQFLKSLPKSENG